MSGPAKGAPLRCQNKARKNKYAQYRAKDTAAINKARRAKKRVKHLAKATKSRALRAV